MVTIPSDLPLLHHPLSGRLSTSAGCCSMLTCTLVCTGVPRYCPTCKAAKPGDGARSVSSLLPGRSGAALWPGKLKQAQQQQHPALGRSTTGEEPPPGTGPPGCQKKEPVASQNGPLRCGIFVVWFILLSLSSTLAYSHCTHEAFLAVHMLAMSIIHHVPTACS